MHIITKRRLTEFWTKHPDAESPPRLWYTRTKNADWNHLAELRRVFPTADLVGRLTVFNVGGNKYRLICRVEYEKKRVYIRNVLTHEEYDQGKWKDDDWF